MRFFVLFVASLFLSLTLFGCDVGRNMMKPAMQDKPMTEDKPPVEENTMGGMKQEEEPTDQRRMTCQYSLTSTS